MPLPTDNLLSAFHDGETTPAERVSVEQCLAASTDARRELSEFQQISALLKDLPGDRLPTEFPQQVLQAIEREMLIPSQSVDSTDAFAARTNSSRRWIGAAAVLVSAAGLLLLVRALDDRPGRGGQKVTLMPESTSLFSTPEGDVAESSLAAKTDASASLALSSNTAAGAAGQNSVAASAPGAMLGSARIAGEPATGNLYFDQAALNAADIGDVVRAIQRVDGDEAVVVYLTVVDRKQELENLQLLLAKKHIPRSKEKALSKADRASPSEGVSDELEAILVKSDVAHMEAVLTQLRQENKLQSLEVDGQPILLAELDGARGSRAMLADKAMPETAKRATPKSLAESATSTRRAKSAESEAADLKPAPAGASSALNRKPGDSAAKSDESRESNEPLANLTRFGVSEKLLRQNQLAQQSRARSYSKDTLRSRSLAEKDATASDETRQVQVLFVVVDKAQASKSQTSPANAPKPAAAPVKTRAEPAKSQGQDGAA